MLAPTYLVNGGVALDVHELGDTDGAGATHTAEVVPHEVHDHEVFRHVLFSFRKVGRKGQVFGGRLPPAWVFGVCWSDVAKGRGRVASKLSTLTRISPTRILRYECWARDVNVPGI